MPISKINSVAISSLSHFVGKAKGDYGKILGNTFAAGQSSPSVITTNLIQHLDASNSNSYSGTGTTWSDLSSEGHDLTLINSPTYTTSDVGGEFYFDGVSEAARINYSDASGLRIGEDSTEVNAIGNPSRTYNDIDDDGGLTIQAWVKPLSFTGTPPTAASQHEAVLIFSNNGHVSISEVGDIYRRYYQGIEFVLGRNSNLTLFQFDGRGGNASTNRIDVRTIDNFLSSTSPGIGDYVDSWVNIAVTINGETVSNETTLKSEIKFYIQGQPVASSYIRAWSDYTEGTGLGIGYRAKYTSAQSTEYHAGIALRRGVYARQSMSHLLQYNDVLTDSEILQNYNATKTRHGY